jgi:hypothetical protein
MNVLLVVCFFAVLVLIALFVYFWISTERAIDRGMERSINRLREIERRERRG